MKKLIVSQYKRAKEFYLRYERLLMPATLVAGFLVDYFTFTNVKISITFSVLFIYWVVSGINIAFINLYDQNKISPKLKYARLYSPLLLQFTFGALLGGSFVFYWFSGAFSVSWPFIIIIAALMISNDIFRHHFLNPGVQIGVYFFISFSFFALILPFIFNSISQWLFLLAGILSFGIFLIYVFILSSAGGYLKEKRKTIFSWIIAIFIFMNFLYFTDRIPPIPLSIREAGVYHNIKNSNGKYILSEEPEPLLQKWLPGQTLHLTERERAYVYTSVFAPAKLDTTIVHQWQYYDTIKKDWLVAVESPFNIFGGRKEGYQGYSWLTNPKEGKWRVYVKTKNNQTLGRIDFEVEKVQSSPGLHEIIR